MQWCMRRIGGTVCVRVSKWRTHKNWINIIKYAWHKDYFFRNIWTPKPFIIPAANTCTKTAFKIFFCFFFHKKRRIKQSSDPYTWHILYMEMSLALHTYTIKCDKNNNTTYRLSFLYRSLHFDCTNTMKFNRRVFLLWFSVRKRKFKSLSLSLST